MLRRGSIRVLISGLAVASLFTLGGFAQTSSTSGKLDRTDKTFVDKAAEGGLAEVEFANLALQKTSNDDVKSFAQRMVHDHTQANDKLKELASNEGFSIPDHLSAKDKMAKEKLEKLSGDQFDKAYMKDMVQDHTQDVAEFRQETEKAQDPGVKNFAQQTLPILESHLQEAKTIAPKVEREANAGNNNNTPMAQK